MIFLDLPPKPAIIQPSEPWERSVSDQLAGMPRHVRLGVIAELRKLRRADGLIHRADLGDLSRWSRRDLAMLPGMGPVIRPPRRHVSPVVQGTRTVSSNANGSGSLAVALPASITVGEGLLIVITTMSDGNTTFTAPAGWMQVTPGGSVSIVAMWKIADGTEGSSVTVTTGNTYKHAAVSYRMTPVSGTPQIGAQASGTSANADPPTITPSWGSDAMLVIAATTNRAAIGGAPSGYSNLTARAQGSDTFGCAEKAVAAASESPAAFTSTSAAWIANTIAIRGG